MQAGSYAAVYVVTAALLLADEDREAGVAFVAGTIAWMGVKKLKQFIGRGRPQAHLDGVHVRGQAQTGLGFPSGPCENWAFQVTRVATKTGISRLCSAAEVS